MTSPGGTHALPPKIMSSAVDLHIDKCKDCEVLLMPINPQAPSVHTQPNASLNLPYATAISVNKSRKGAKMWRCSIIHTAVHRAAIRHQRSCISKHTRKRSPICGLKSLQSASNSARSFLAAAELKQKFTHLSHELCFLSSSPHSVPWPLRKKRGAGNERWRGCEWSRAPTHSVTHQIPFLTSMQQ